MELKRFTSMVLVGLVAIVPGSCNDAVGPIEDQIEQLLFLSNRDAVNGAGLDVYRINDDGTGVERLTTQSSSVWYQLSLSPDGSRIAFTKSERCDIFVMNTDGTNPHPLTNRDGGFEERCNGQPRWSRDGSRIAFMSNRESRAIGTTHGLYDVYVMNADGSDPHNVSRAAGDAMGHNVDMASWTPDGRVVFETSGVANGANWRRVYVVNADGSGLRPLFNREGDYSPFWSPDGSKVVFISGRDGRQHLYLMNADGSDERALTTGAYDHHLGIGPAAAVHGSSRAEYDPWSPDGTRIAFVRWDPGSNIRVVHVINANGTGLQPVSPDDSNFNGWSPDGARIAITIRSSTQPFGPPEVFVMNADGTDLSNLSNHPGADSHAMWIRSR